MAEINVTSAYRLLSPAPLDAKLAPVANVAALNNIPSGQRYKGMTVTVLNDGSGKQADYWLYGGTGNSNWQKKASESLQIEKLAAPSSSAYSDTYQLEVVGSTAALGAQINIPKDYRVVQSCASTVSAADKAAGGKFSANTDFVVGDRYADFVINTKSKDGEESHIYLNCQPIINDLYIEDSGITITTGTSSNTLSVKLDPNSQAFLTVGVDGVKLSDIYANKIELGDVVVDANGNVVYASGKTTHEAIQDLYTRTEQKGLSAVTSSDKSLEVNTLHSVADIKVSRELGTTETRDKGHIEIKQNDKGELYAVMYYMGNENSTAFIDALNSSDLIITINDSLTLSGAVVNNVANKVIEVTKGSALVLKNGFTANANATLKGDGTIIPTNDSVSGQLLVVYSSGATMKIGSGITISSNGRDTTPIMPSADGKVEITGGFIEGSATNGCVYVPSNHTTVDRVVISGGVFKLYGWDSAPSYGVVPTLYSGDLIKVQGLGYKWNGSSYVNIDLIDVEDAAVIQPSQIIKVSGGTFYGRDPQLGDGHIGSTYVAAGYKSVERSDEPGVFDVVPN